MHSKCTPKSLSLSKIYLGNCLLRLLDQYHNNPSVGSSGCVVERRTVNGMVVQSHLPPFQNIGNLPVSFGRDTKSRWSFLSGVYAGGSKRSHTGGNV